MVLLTTNDILTIYMSLYVVQEKKTAITACPTFCRISATLMHDLRYLTKIRKLLGVSNTETVHWRKTGVFSPRWWPFYLLISVVEVGNYC